MNITLKLNPVQREQLKTVMLKDKKTFNIGVKNWILDQSVADISMDDKGKIIYTNFQMTTDGQKEKLETLSRDSKEVLVDDNGYLDYLNYPKTQGLIGT